MVNLVFIIKYLNKICVVTLLLCLLISFTMFASSLDQSRIYYNKTDYYKSTWQWLDFNNDGLYECYYFNVFGHIYKNSKTPDGYYVNIEGQLTINNEVQYKTFLELKELFNGNMNIPSTVSSAIHTPYESENTYVIEVKDEFTEELNDLISKNLDEINLYIITKEIDKRLLNNIVDNYIRKMKSLEKTYYKELVKLYDNKEITKEDLKATKMSLENILDIKEKYFKTKVSDYAKIITWTLSKEDYEINKKNILTD